MGREWGSRDGAHGGAQDPRSPLGAGGGAGRREGGWISASVRLLSRGCVPPLKSQEGDILGLKYKIKSSPTDLRWVGSVPPSE